MANIINGTDTGSGGLITTGDSSDELQLQTAETARVTLTNTAVVVNEGGNDLDFRVEGDTDANTLFVDAGNDRVGVKTATPAVALDVVGQVRASTGILFGSDTAAANALDDYEEGTWTPTLGGSTVTGTPSGTAEGTYTKIGNFVYASFRFANYSVSGNTGNIVIYDLPFTSTGRMNGAVSYAEGITFTFTAATNDTTLFLIGSSGSTFVSLKPQNAGSGYDKVVTAVSFAGSNGYMYGFVAYPA